MMHNFMVRDIIPPVKVKKYAKKPDSAGPVPFVSCQTTNNGIACMCDIEPEVKNCITVSTNGNCFDCFYHDYAIVPSADVEVLYRKGITDVRERALYLCAVLRPFTKLYSYSNKPKNGKVFDTIIALPVVESSDPHHVYTPDDIDWAYMEDHIRRLEEDHIRRLEEDHIRRLEEYLKVAGFESTILTSEEQEVLRKFRTGGVIFRKYRICDLFDVKTTHSFNKNSINIYSKGDIDFIGRSSVNNGIQGKCKRESVNPNPANTFSVVQVGESVCLFREREWYASQNIFIMYPKNSDLSRNHLFIQAAVNKILGQMYKSAYVYPKLNDIKNLEISLPCLPSGTPDYAIMETYIRALEKQAISRLDTMQKEEEKLTKEITKVR